MTSFSIMCKEHGIVNTQCIDLRPVVLLMW